MWRWDTAQHFSSYEITLCKSRCFQFSLILIFPCKKCNKKDWNQNARQLELLLLFFFFYPVIMVRTGLGDWLLLPLVSLKKNYTKPRLLLLSSLLSFSGAWPLDTSYMPFLFFSFCAKISPPPLFFSFMECIYNISWKILCILYENIVFMLKFRF